MKKAALLQLEARKEEAFDRFLRFMLTNRKPEEPLSKEAEAAYVDGLRLGYGKGLTEGFALGFDVGSESSESFDVPHGGSA